MEPLDPALLEEARRQISKTEETEPAEKLPFAPGSRVRHRIFGEGTVLLPGEGGIIIQFDRIVTPRTIGANVLEPV